MRKFKKIIFAILGLYLLLVVSLYFFQEALIFLPTHLEQDYRYEFNDEVKELNLKSGDITLNGLHFKVKNPKGIILYFHGNAGDLSRWGEVVQPLLKFNYDIIVMDYRGYGKSKGEFSEAGMHHDAQLFYEYAKGQFNENEIILYGRSLGSAFATSLASNNNPSKLILETPFYSIRSVAKQRFPFLPVDWLLKYDFETHKLARAVTCPTLVLLSKNDEVVGYETGLKLAQQFNSAQTISIEEAGHNNQAQFETYWNGLSAFLQDQLVC